MIKRGQHLLAFLLAFFVCTSAFAQTFTEDFEKFGAAEEPPGWLDTSDAKFTTSVDPDVATNIVYGAKFTIPKQRSVHRAPRTNHPSGGAISTLSGRVFSAGQSFEYRGRFYRATDASLLGFTFFSMQPEIETHRMVALWRRGNESVPTMQLYRDTRLHAHSEFTPRAGQWYRFAIRVEGARIRVRFWADGTAEPQPWAIDFTDAEVAGESGRIGLWAGAGTTYFDDLHVIAKSSEEVDTVGPAIIFSESGERIASGATELFNRDAKIDVRALDASGIRSLTVTVDGNAYTPGATIATEKTHTLRARAVDNKGNASEASVEVVVDKTPPVIAIAPLPEVTSAAVTPQVSVTDQTATTVTVRLDGAPFTAGSVVDAEGTHTLAVTATDAVGWTATKNVTFTIDRTAPSLVFRENGQVVTTSLTRHQDVAIDIAATDAHGVATSSATLNGAPYSSDTPITADGTHVLVANAIDRAGNAATAQLTIVIDKSKPAVSITNVPEITKAAVTPHITTTAGTLAATLNGNPFAIGSTIDAEGEYTLVATATDDRGNTSSASVTFIIDRTAPTVTLTDAGENVSNAIARNRDVAIVVAANDAHGVASLTSTLEGAAYASGTVISSERTHALVARAVDRAGNESTAELSILIDKTAPVVTIDAIAELTKENVTPRITATEGTIAVTLNGSAYVIGTPIDAEREHTLVATATDAVGNSGSATVTFTIDRTPPSISFTEAGEAVAGSLTRNRDVAIAIAANDANGIASLQSTLDGAAYTSGTAISSEGTHALAVRAVDRAGNEATAQLSILIDKSGPVVAIHDVPALTKNNVTPRIVASEGTISATLNGAPFTPGATIDVEREHTLVATVTDAVGNTGSASVTFTIDRTPPSISLTEAGQIVSGSIGRNRDIAIAVAASDAHGVASVQSTLDNAPYTSGTSIATEGTHALAVRAIDNAGNEATSQLSILIDKTAPVVAIHDVPELTKNNVTPRIVTSEGTISATLDGAPFTAGTTIDTERAHTLVATATDAVGNSGSATAIFTIDRTPPVIIFTSPAAEQRLGERVVTATGTYDDAVRIVVNGIDAALDAATKTFAATLELTEGANTLAALGYDLAGNEGLGSLRVHLDSQAPELAVLAPAPNVCLGATNLIVRGTASDAASVSVRANDGAPVSATIDGHEWTASVPVPEGNVILTIEARDAAAHVVSTSLPLTVDRTKPVVRVTERGATFAATLLNRDVAPFAALTDADKNATLTLTLNGAPYVSGTPIRDERAHVLRATAVDCAGNAADPVEVAFTIDRTPPSILTLAPASGAAVGTKPPLTGTLSEPGSVIVEESGLAATVNGTSFTLPVPFGEGLNELALVATDLAGNSARVPYSLRVKSDAPSVEIVENGLAIPPAALFNRALAPVIRVSDANATLAATLNGQPFTSGTRITGDDTYTLVARATDAFGHVSEEARATFSIDTTPPRVAITAPAADSVTPNAAVEVRGTVDTDAESVTVNGTRATISNGTFAATLQLEQGPNVLTASAVDRAGNSGADHVAVTRNAARLAIFLTSPPDELLTNRPTTVVAGQVLNAPPSGTVRINSVDVPVDSTGAFRKVDFALAEGENEITAAVASATGELNAVSVDVTADFTPPSLLVTANGLALAEGARFAIAPRLALEASDNVPQGLTTRLTIDGAAIVGEVPQLGDGGHALTAIARDAAGNETRVDRTFFVGHGSSGGGCALTNFDPVDGSAVFTELVRITGRSGGATGVLIDGKAAQVADGSFCGEATLQPGRNEVEIRCADASGKPTADAPVTLVLWRDVEPSVAITAPVAGATLTANTITVTGTVSAGVVSGDVNGLPMVLNGTAFAVENVAVTSGLNVITARAKTGSGRTAIATTRVTLRNAAPQLAITAPLEGTQSGAASLDVSGTYANVDPTTIRIGNVSATTTALTDTSGTFTATVQLAPGTTNTITVTGRNHAGTNASAAVAVQHVVGNPAIAITAPADNAYVSTTTLRVTGTVAAEEGAQVQVNGVAATVTGNAFAADVELANGVNPIVARVATPSGGTSSDNVRVTRLAQFAVRDMFPSANATNVDRGAAVVLLFTNALDGDTAANAVRVTDGANTAIDGTLFTDRDALTFAPHAPLKAGETYTVAISTALRDASGATLAAAHTLRFTTAATAPAAPPLVDDVATTGCLSTVTLTGRATIPGARVRLDADGVTLTTDASDTGAFKFTFSFSGQPGFHIARVRQVGTDGSLSADRAICFRINCELPRVVGASLDRAARKLTIDFSRPMDASTLTANAAGTILLVPQGGVALSGTVSVTAETATVTFADEIPNVNVALTVKKDVRDAAGASPAADYTQLFSADADGTELGKGYVTGAVYDATTGRPLANATVAIRGGDVLHTNDRGRYSRALGEGAYTIEATADGYTTVWRQVVVPAGAGVVPIDIRLTRAGASQTTNGAALTLTHGGDSAVTRVAELTLAAASLPPGRNVRLTAIGAQSLAGLLPLGWSPHAAAEVVVEGESATPGATLAFRVDVAAITAAQQTLSLVQYDVERDEWRVVRAVATIDSGKATFDITQAGHYALVYPDAAPHLTHPPVARDGAVLKGVANPCSDAPETCALTSRTFTLEPRAVLPNGRAVATLVTEGATQTYPSGTAAQAYIDEQLNLADGRVLVDPPFAVDLLVYRTLAGDAGVAAFHLAPTSTAAAVMLRDGVERVRIVDYPGRIDRGTLVGAEGGRVPGDDSVTLDVPTGATSEPLHARTTSIPANELATYGNIAGFRVAGGFALELTRANAPPSPDDSPLATPSLLLPARATFAVPESALAGATTQAIVVEVLPQTSYGVAFQLVAIADAGDAVSGARLFTTRTVDSTALPIDGIVRDGRYLILVAEAPIAFAYGQVRAGAGGVVIPNARVSASSLGVTSITASPGVFVLPVRSAPAAPFSLIARTPATGDGAAATANAAPAAGAFVNFGALELVAQPPHLRSVSPDGGEVPVDAAFVVRAEFDTVIDPASVAGAIEVTNLTTQQRMAGTVSAAGAIVTFNPGEPLRAASEYSITITPTIRALNGAPFGELVVKTFTTSARPRGSTAYNPDRIRITMPDANGRSTIRGTAGALPAGAQAVAVRRGRFFVEAYQATVASDGSFSFEAGRGARDRITIEDVIDLHVVDAVSRAVVAMIELTPFASDDARSFIARHDRETTFISAEGFVVRVPAGAFERPTLVHVAPAQQAAFAEVPSFANELDYGASVELTFDGVAKKRLQVSLPIPSTVDAANRGWYLGCLGASSRGPRVMLVDVMHVAGGMFVSGPASTQNNIRNIRTHAAGSIQTNAALTGAEVSEYLLGMERSGIYAALDLRVPEATLAWGFLEGLQGSYDLFWDTLESLYSAHFYMVERGRVAIPIIAGKQFQVVGVDAATGLEAYTKVYDPIPVGDPGAAVTLPDPNPDRTGPYPVFATPFRVETFDLNVRNVDITTIRDFTIRLQNAQVKVTTTLAAEVAVALLNVTQGLVDPSRDGGLALDAAVGDRIVLVIAQTDVDPYTPVSVVFDEPLHLPNGDAGLAALFTVETRSDEEAPYVAITEALRFSSDSGGRRVTVHLPASLTRGNSYRIGIKPEVRNATGLKIGQARDAKGVATGGRSEPLYLDFTVREPGGRVASFDLPEGVVRDQALNGNILIVSAGGGGVYAYDVSDPAAMVENSAPLPHKIPGYSTDYWAVTSDHHGRVYTTGMNALYGMVQSFRLEHFNKLPPPPDPDPNPDYEGIRPMSGAIVSWRPGAAAGMEITSRLLATDRAEAIPRRLQVLLQDSEVAYESREDFKAGASVSVEDVNGEFETLTATFARDFDAELEINPNRTYLIQRITVENITLDMRWSGDATVNGPAVIEGIVARKGDRLRVIRNQTTYGVVSLFGYGVAIYDLNAVESNDVLAKPAEYVLLREQIRMTNGKRATWCGPAIPDSIPDLEFTPDSLVTSQPGSSDLKVYALDVARGVLDLKVTPPAVSFDDEGNTVNAERVSACSERAPEGLIFRMRTFTPEPGDTTMCRGYKHHPRLWAICNAYDVQLKRAPFGRFTGASFHRWTIEANDNRVVTPASGEQPALGQRGTRANTRAQRDYMLIPGNEYGLLVVEIPKNGWLAKSHLADVIWIPHGANAVRTIPRTNLATVVDGRGHVLLVDLSRIDERWDENGLTDQTKLFRTAASLLQNGFEKPDPRIVWISDTPLATGTLAPAIDPNTGFVYVGKILAKTTEVVAAIDPRLQIKVNTGSPNGLSEVGGIVPLGVDPPKDVLLIGDDASLAAFRLEVALPGGLDASLGGSFRLRVQNERVPGATVEDTPAGWPRAHLDIPMQRVVPPIVPELRFQRGFNRWISPWIVGVADLRASEKWQWSNDTTIEQKREAGCPKCERPSALQKKPEPEVFELYTAGRTIALLPNLSALSGTRYDYLAQSKRLAATIASVPADTLRPREVQVAAHNPPIAEGALQETTYLHSGEVATGAVDLNAGGRAGFDVIADRSYLSRTIGSTPFGAGWASMLFRRLRALPNGDVEYRDGAGEVWLFKYGRQQYTAAAGLDLRLNRTNSGWMLLDQQLRQTHFDNLGRLTAETDRLYDGKGAGNITRYLYDPAGRLARIVDAVNRETSITYNASGLVDEIADWRQRTVKYHYAGGLLTRVELPEAKAAEGVPAELNLDYIGAKRPRIEYAYDGAGGTALNALAELKTNLKSITDPAEVASGGEPRVTFTYTGDRVTQQTWATDETATFSYAGSTASVLDALGQRRTYTLTDRDVHDKRVHVAKVVAEQVPVLQFGQTLPEKASPGLQPQPQDLLTTYTYFDDGHVDTVTLPNLLKIASTYADAVGAPGKVLRQTTETGPLFANRTTVYDRNPGTNLVEKTTRIQNGQTLPRHVPHQTRTLAKTSVEDDGVKVFTHYDKTGRVTQTLQGASEDDPAVSSTTTYHPDDSAPLERGRPWHVIAGGGMEHQKLEYAAGANGGEVVEIEDAVNGAVTTITTDSFGRTVHEINKDASGTVLSERRLGYDASGRLTYEARPQTGVGTVVTRIRYDALGRELETSITEAAVEGTPVLVKATTEYDLAERKITRNDPTSGASVPAREVTILDGFGRPREIERSGATAQRVLQRFAYAASGALSYQSDTVRAATLYQHDAAGRTTATVASDGTRATVEYTPWDETDFVAGHDAKGNVVSEAQSFFTAEGRLKSTNEQAGAKVRKTLVSMLEGGRWSVVHTGEVETLAAAAFDAGQQRRVQITERDMAGRVVSERIGESGPIVDFDSDEGMLSITTRTFLPGGSVGTTTREPKGGAYDSRVAFDGLGRPVEQTHADTYTSTTTYDEAGNPRLVKHSDDTTDQAEYDSRGLVTKRILADKKTNLYRYDAMGNVVQRIDEAGESTFYDYDALGRQKSIRYFDGTYEELTYEDKTGAVAARRDRAGKWLAYSYDEAGRVAAIHEGTSSEAAVQVKYTHDDAGRVTLVRNADAGIAYEEYDFLGRPGITRTYRYLPNTGLTDAPKILDVHVQRHNWSIHDGERSSWRMPAAGTALPSGDTPGSKWLQTIVETRDAGSNLIAQTKQNGDALSTAEARGLGRLRNRRRHLGSGGTMSTAYGFADGPVNDPEFPLPVGAEPAPATGLPLWNATTTGAAPIAGTVNSRDRALRLDSLRDLTSSQRTAWDYDDRGRLAMTWRGGQPMAEGLIDADFRASRGDAQLLTEMQRERLGKKAAEIEPAAWTANRTTAHRIDDRTLMLAGVPPLPRDYEFTGGRRTTDGVWSYTFDDLGRMTSAKSADRRIDLFWNPNNRLVGRIAYQADATNGWTLEARTDVLARDGLPAQSTFVWDPIVDRLLAIYHQGASIADGAAAESGLIRQYLHGDQAYDDPTRVIAVDAAGTPRTWYPIVDETGTGSITAIADENGHLAERILYADAYGDAPRYLHGPVAQKIETAATKDASGNVQSVHVFVKLSDRINATTLAAGVRLAAIKADKTIALLSSVTPTLEDDGYTIHWTLTASEWNTLKNAPSAQSLEIALTSALRTETWPTTPVAPAPAWTLAVYPDAATTATTPVIYRESFASVTTTTTTRTLYEIRDLYVAASEESKTKLFTGFHALPFTEPATGLVYARARWYDPATGTFLSPDPLGYIDSSSLYPLCGGDPVNCSDPTGEWGVKEAWETTKSVAGFVVGVGESAVETVHSLNPVVSTYERVKAVVPRAKRIAAAYRSSGAAAAAQQYAAEVKDYTTGVVKALPIINTIRQAAAIPEAYDAGAFEGGRQVGRVTFSLAGDATVIYGGVKSVHAARASRVSTGRIAAPLEAQAATPVRAYNVNTAGLSPAEAAAVREYAQRTNAWLRQAGPQTIQSTHGQLRTLASAAARRERLRAARSGQPYQGQAGHVPDTAITGQAVPPAGWLDMPGVSNQCCGGGLGSRIGQTIDVITVDGAIP